MKSFICFILTLTHFCFAHAAGGERGNGGDLVINDDGALEFLDLVRKPNINVSQGPFVNAIKALEAILLKHPGMRDATVASTHVDISTPTESPADRILSYARSLRFIRVNSVIPEVGDRGEVIFPLRFQGQIKRFAIQYASENLVKVDDALFTALLASPNGQNKLAAFVLHEALIQAVYRETGTSGVDRYSINWSRTIERIAAVVQEVFGNGSLDVNEVAWSLCQTGIPTFSTKAHGLHRFNEFPVNTFYLPKQVFASSFSKTELVKDNPEHGTIHNCHHRFMQNGISANVASNDPRESQEDRTLQAWDVNVSELPDGPQVNGVYLHRMTDGFLVSSLSTQTFGASSKEELTLWTSPDEQVVHREFRLGIRPNK